MSPHAFLAFTLVRGLHRTRAGCLHERGGFPFPARVLYLPERDRLAAEEKRHGPVGGDARFVANALCG